jgi:hypothetical protein
LPPLQQREREAHTIVAKRERGENMREMRSRRVDK